MLKNLNIKTIVKTPPKVILTWQREHPGYPILARALEIAALILFTLVSLKLVVDLSQAAVSLGVSTNLVVMIFFAVLLGFLCADLLSGLVHFWCDHVSSEKTPILGPVFVKHFLLHHDKPGDITEHDFIETNGNNCLASIFLMLPLVYTSTEINSLPIFLCYCVHFSLSLFLALTNQSHKWAHQSNPNSLVTFFQKRGLLLSPGMHALHHRSPFNTHFCITSGVLNTPLERLGLFEWLSTLTMAGRS